MAPAAAEARGAAFLVALAAAELVWSGAPEEVAVLMELLPDLEEEEPVAAPELLEPVWVEERVLEAVEREREELGAPEVTVLERMLLEEAEATVLELSMTKYGV